MAADDMLQDWVDYLHQLIQGLAKNQLDTEITIAGLEQELAEIINDNNSKEKLPQETGLIIEQISLLEPIEWSQEKIEEKTQVLSNPITREVTKEELPEQPSQSLPPMPTQIDNPSTDKEKDLNPVPTETDNFSMDTEKNSNEVIAHSFNEQTLSLQIQRQALAEKEQALNIQAQELEKQVQALAQREQALKIQEQALQQQQQQLAEQAENNAVVHKKTKKKKKGKLEEYAENQQETDNDPDDYDDYEEEDYEPYKPKRNFTPFIIIILVIILTIGISMFYFPTESAHFFHLLWGK
jgi:hypothetical protein